MAREKRREYKSGSIYYNAERDLYIGEISYFDPATGARKYRRKSAKPNKVGKEPQGLKDWLADLQGKKRSGEDLNEKSATVAEWLPLWLKVHKPNIRATTRESYDGLIKIRIVPELGATKLKLLTQTLLQKFVNDLSAKYSPRGVQYTMTIFKQALNCAIENGLLSLNPARNVKIPAKIRHETHAPEIDEVGRFLDAARKTRFYMYFLMLAVTGMRRAEALALKWSDIDLDAGAVNIQRTIVETRKGGVEFHDPKTKAGRRRVLIPPDVISELKTHRKELLELQLKNASVWEKNDLLFPVQDGSPQNPHNIENAFYRIMRRAGLGELVEIKAEAAEEKKQAKKSVESVKPRKKKEKCKFIAKFRLHDLRHAHATDLMKKGWPARAVQERLGHNDIAVTLSTYSHVRQEMQQDLSNSLAGMYTS